MFLFLGDAAPASSVKMATRLYWQLRRAREALYCCVTRQSPEHCSSSAWMLHIVRPFIHFGSQSSHSVVTLHYTQPHCSVHLEAIFTSNSVKGRSRLYSTESACGPASLATVKFLFQPVEQISHSKLILTYISGPAYLSSREGLTSASQLQACETEPCSSKTQKDLCQTMMIRKGPSDPPSTHGSDICINCIYFPNGPVSRC